MLTKKDRTAQYKAIEELRLRRVRNLRQLSMAYGAEGNWAELGRQCGQSSTFLIALAGPNPRRNIGEKLARDLETALRLPTGWLDKTH